MLTWMRIAWASVRDSGEESTHSSQRYPCNLFARLQRRSRRTVTRRSRYNAEEFGGDCVACPRMKEMPMSRKLTAWIFALALACSAAGQTLQKITINYPTR